MQREAPRFTAAPAAVHLLFPFLLVAIIHQHDIAITLQPNYICTHTAPCSNTCGKVKEGRK